MDARQPTLDRKVRDRSALCEEQRTRDCEDCLGTLPGHGRESAGDLIGSLDPEYLERDLRRPGGTLEFSQAGVGARIVLMPERRQAGQLRDDLAENLETFARQ